LELQHLIVFLFIMYFMLIVIAFETVQPALSGTAYLSQVIVDVDLTLATSLEAQGGLLYGARVL
jgi:hypothetical protein